MSRRDPQARLNLAMILAAATLACLSLAHAPGLTEGLTYLAPLIFVLLLLWLGRYPGERMLLALIRPDRPRRAGTANRGRPRLHARLPRGGRLLASSLAGRAPPLAARLR